MQQFKTYPGIPPSGVVERPSILRIPPLPPVNTHPPLRHHLCFFPLAALCVLLHLTGNFGRIKWDHELGVWGCVSACSGGHRRRKSSHSTEKVRVDNMQSVSVF